MTAPRKEVLAEGVEIWLGDCREVMAAFPPCFRVDAFITDPPYGIGFKYKSHIDDESEYEGLITSVVASARGMLREGGSAFFWQGMKHADRFHKYFPAGFRLFAALRNFTQFLPVPMQYSWDPAVYWFEGKSNKKSIAGERDYHIGNTAKYIGEKTSGHPCPRPLDTVEYVVRCLTVDGETICDPFMGSGTTGVAAVKLGRKFIGIEIDETYFNIARRRIGESLKQPDFFVETPKPVVKQEQFL